MFSLITTIIAIALAVGVTGATMYYLSGTDDASATIAAAELLTQSEQIAAAIDMRAVQEKGVLADLNTLVSSKYLTQVPLPPEYAFVSGESAVSDWQVPQANPRPVVLVSNKIKESVCSAFNNKMLSDASIPAQANPALRIQCFGAEEPYSVVINPSMNPDQLVAVLPSDTNTTTPEPDAQLPVPQTVALDSANLCFKQGVAGSFDFKTVFSASQEATPTTAEVVWAATGTLPAGMQFDTATGVISGTPTEKISGSDYTVTASYKNAEGKQVYKLLVKGSELEVVSISGGGSHTCAVTTSGGAKCWGSNSSGQLGNNSFARSLVPVDVSGLTSGVASIASGWGHTCAVTTSGGAKCWGWNYYGQLGNNSTPRSSVPVDVSGLTSGVASIAGGYDHTCAVTTSGGAKCWGWNGNGQLGNNSTSRSLVPVDVSGLTSGVASIASGWAHTCAVTTSGGAKCWGYNYYGQLGNNSNVQSKVPVDVAGLTSGVASIASSGANHTCAVTTGGGAKCWGYNNSGQLGNNSTTNSRVPVDVSGLTSGVASIASSGANHTCAVTTGGGAKCWGENGNGQLGNNSTTDSTVPVDVLNPVGAQTCTNLTLTPSTDGTGVPTISGTISLTPATLPEFKVGEPVTYNFAALYKDSLNASPNMADVTWSGVGTLPAGLMLDPVTGELFGTPTVAAQSSYTVKATYKSSNSGQQTYLVVVR